MQNTLKQYLKIENIDSKYNEVIIPKYTNVNKCIIIG